MISEAMLYYPDKTEKYMLVADREPQHIKGAIIEACRDIHRRYERGSHGVTLAELRKQIRERKLYLKSR
jgi:hypothetical protein